jgi:hypothetical protein
MVLNSSLGVQLQPRHAMTLRTFYHLLLLLLSSPILPPVQAHEGPAPNSPAFLHGICCGDASCSSRLQVLEQRLGHGGRDHIVMMLVIAGVLPSAEAAHVNSCASISQGDASGHTNICSSVFVSPSPRPSSADFNIIDYPPLPSIPLPAFIHLPAHWIFSTEAMLSSHRHALIICIPTPSASASKSSLVASPQFLAAHVSATAACLGSRRLRH